MCHPDLSPYPFDWAGDDGSFLAVLPNVEQRCVVWDTLHGFLEERAVMLDEIDYAERTGQEGPSTNFKPVDEP